ncbi:MAG: SAM-dependent methyltransferase [Armatimonadetes bacterium]|nr:SAM-dependent methyltransferase [Armatimonadota bacterium]
MPPTEPDRRDPPLDPDRPETWPASALAYLRRRQESREGNPALIELLRERIRREGPIPFPAFMETALYHPEHSYYHAPGTPIGRSGDFLTSPETHPAFGLLIARRLHEFWKGLACPPSFTAVEAGGGSGSLAARILSAAPGIDPDFGSALQYILIEPFLPLQRSQQANLSDHAARIRWANGLGSVRNLTGCILSNELVDAFPVHRVRMEAGGLKEYYVDWTQEGFTEVTGPVSDPALEHYFQTVESPLPEGCRAEVNLRGAAWIRQAGTALKRGFVLTIDYGFRAEELFSGRFREGTLRCYWRHTFSDNPYIRVGRQDITSHVDFTSLIRFGAEAGLKPVQYDTQEHFLLSLGIRELLQSEPRGPGYSALNALIDPERLGKFKILAQLKGP